jgi:lysozyme
MTGHSLTISYEGIALIKKHHGLSLEKYRDEKGLWVIGYGHVITAHENLPTIITPEMADILLVEDLAECEKVLSKMNISPLQPDEHDALIAMLFSRGISRDLA